MAEVRRLPEGIQRRVDRIGADRERGASEILQETLDILQDALGGAASVRQTARAICRAQPGMANLWAAGAEALAAEDDPSRFRRFRERVERAPEALRRWGLDCFAAEPGPLRLATLSFSRSVLGVIEALAATRPVRVACSEGRPALEGRRMATALAAAGAAVTFFSDAALAHALGAVDAVVVGADAVTPQSFLNKSGTRMLAAAAAHQGTPVHVVASREKFVSQAVSLRLAVREGDAAEIWPTAPPGVSVRNPYFEPTPNDLVTSFITDAGVIGAAMVADVCESSSDSRWVAELLKPSPPPQ